MNRKSTIKKVLYFVGEIFVVTIGIFIAFQLSNYTENQGIKDREQKSISRIIDDLNLEKKLLTTDKKKFEKSREKLNSIIYYGDRQNLDSLYHHLARQFVHFNSSVEYTTLKYGGNLFLISNDTIRSKLVGYYEFTYSRAKKVEELHGAYMSDMLSDLSDEISYSAGQMYDPSEVEEKLKNKDFLDNIIIQISWFDFIISSFKVNQLNSLISDLEKELKRIANK